MTIGIIGAMEKEIVNLKEKISVVSVRNIIGLDYYIGTLHGNNVVLVRAGIGKVNAAICAQVLIDQFAVDAIINTGIAGAIEKDLKIGDVVISNDAVQHDFDTTVFGDEPGQITGVDEIYFKADDELIKRAYSAVQELGYTAHIGRVSSGDQFINTIEAKERIWKIFKSKCCEMEGAAIAHTCYLNKIPFLVIRVISDNADEGNCDNYESFCVDAANKASEVVNLLIEGLSC